MKKQTIKPHPGPQTVFLSTKADIAVYGGAAGGGKSWALLFEALRHCQNPFFGATIFRRTSTQITQQGGLWDAAQAMYRFPGVKFLDSRHDVVFPSGAKIRFRHMQHEKNKFDHQGSEVALLCFDELTHFTRGQFFYLTSRNRNTQAKIKSYVRATTNPQANSWVKDYLAPWVDQDWREEEERAAEEEGRASLAVGSGEILYTQDGGKTWLHPEEHEFDEETMKSVTFVKSSIYDNHTLLEADPGYVASLKNMDPIQRARLLEGDWGIKEEDILFKEDWFPIVEEADIPWEELTNPVRYWDLAATDEKDAEPGSCFTAGVLMAEHRFSGTMYILDVKHFQKKPYKVREQITRVAAMDKAMFGHRMRIYIEQEPGATGVESIQAYKRHLRGYWVEGDRPTGDKFVRAQPVAQACRDGVVYIKRASWNKPFLKEVTNFPTGLKDQVDGFTGAFHKISGRRGAFFERA